jgi:AcrR family transcriptional regulator
VTKRERNKLSRERVLDATAELVRSEGIDALSMRRLAQRLDVWPMSIYTYFRDKDELLDALAESAVGGLELPSGRALWRNQMRALLHDICRVLGDDASGLAGRMPRAMSSPALGRLSRAGLGILSGAGFGQQEAESAWRALLSYTVGFTTTSASAAAAAEAEVFDRGLDALLDGLSASLPPPPATPRAR